MSYLILPSLVEGGMFLAARQQHRAVCSFHAGAKVSLSVCLSVCLSVRDFAYVLTSVGLTRNFPPFLHLSLCLSLSLSPSLSVSLSLWLSLSLSGSLYLSLSLSLYLSLSLSLSISLSRTHRGIL